MEKQFRNSVHVITAFFCLLCLVSCSSLAPVKKDADQRDKIKTNGVQQKAELSKIRTRLDQLEERVNFQEESTEKLKKKVDRLEITCKKSVLLEKPPLKLHQHNKIKYTGADTESGKLYRKARSLLLEGNFKKAEVLFMQFIKKYPENDLADNAFYWLGECHYTTGDYKGAVKIFKALVKKYPKRGKVPDALLKTAYAYLSLDDINRASYYLKLVVRKYPFTAAGEKAELKLHTFQ